MGYLNFSWILQGQLAGSQGPTNRRDLMFLERNRIRAVLRMEEKTISAEEWEMLDMYEPVPDGTAPHLDQMERMVKFLDDQIEKWERPVVVTCAAGLGRTGTVIASYLVFRGHKPQWAINLVRQLRPGSLQTPEQAQVVHQYAELLEEREREKRRKALEALDDR